MFFFLRQTEKIITVPGLQHQRDKLAKEGNSSKHTYFPSRDHHLSSFFAYQLHDFIDAMPQLRCWRQGLGGTPAPTVAGDAGDGTTTGGLA